MKNLFAFVFSVLILFIFPLSIGSIVRKGDPVIHPVFINNWMIGLAIVCFMFVLVLIFLMCYKEVKERFIDKLFKK